MTRGKLKPGNLVYLALGAQPYSHAMNMVELFDLSLSTQFTEHLETALWAWLEEAGKLPLPPYIEREADELDSDRYQTVFAKEPGRSTPTAGLLRIY